MFLCSREEEQLYETRVGGIHSYWSEESLVFSLTVRMLFSFVLLRPLRTRLQCSWQVAIIDRILMGSPGLALNVKEAGL